MNHRSILLWFFILITFLIYAGIISFVVWIPCQVSLLIGFCTLGKIIISGLGLILFATYSLLIFLFQGLRETLPAQTKDTLSLFVQVLCSVLFWIIPLAFLLGVLKHDPALQPYAQPSLRHNGLQQIEFISFNDTPVKTYRSEEKFGFIASGVIRVSKSGQYDIYPIHLIGDVPILVLDADRTRLAQVIQRYLVAGESYQFDYFVEIQAKQVGINCSLTSWKVLWQIESNAYFPLYLFGKGAFAQVYPDNTGDYAYVTHINSNFRTMEHLVCIN